MQRVIASSLLIASALGSQAFSQQAAPTPALSGDSSDRPRIYVTDSNSWSVRGSAGGSNGVFGGSSSGGAQPQTAEIIKTFGQRCPQVTVNNRADVSNYVVELDHEGGKSVLAHKDKIAVFVQKTGDSIFSKSTLSVGGSVQDACGAILAHWAIHSAELRPAVASPNEVSPGTSLVPQAAQISSITVDASVPNCDIEIDGNFMGSTPSTLNLAPGKHQIVVKKAGFQEWSRTMTLTTGVIRVSATMVPLSPSADAPITRAPASAAPVAVVAATPVPVTSTPLPTTSNVTVEASVANCDIEVDGRFVGSTPSKFSLAPGQHEIVVKKAGYRSWQRIMNVASGVTQLNAQMVAAP
jgi:hypothetical protein